MLQRFKNTSAFRLLAAYAAALAVLLFVMPWLAERLGASYVRGDAAAGASLVAFAFLMFQGCNRAIFGGSADLVEEIEEVIGSLVVFAGLLCLRRFAVPQYGPVNLFEVATVALFSYFGLLGVVGMVKGLYYYYRGVRRARTFHRMGGGEEGTRGRH